ncbi:GCYB2-like protein [Mya arenaria]|uniref:GCYB2-like protein n=1 Tax=Mya arenaria TaxID=6604 RepID=A0ABY7G033_MYAAR|nr:GCYB2-like protein [Mya arenaria]
MFLLRDRGFYAYMASPAAHCWADLENRKLKLSDIPMWDVTRDFLVANLEYRKCIETNVRASLSGSQTDGRRISVSGARRGSLGDEAAIRDRISRLQSEAEKERRKNEALYSAFLPKDAIDLVNGGLVPYGDFQPQVTALFCDVVKFLPIVAKSSPQDVIGMLDAMYTTFDKITRVHDTYRVESIGDAYLVIAGTGNQKEHHAERVANTALGMLLAARNIKAPPDNISVTLRIGIHTGSLVTGVLGNRLPRFVVMGETTVVASKLESHSEPGKIHVSPTTQTILKDKGYQFEARGKIDLRGYGPLETYFLVKNDLFSDEELIGRSHGNQEVTYINEGKVEATFAKQNKVHPLTTSPPSGVLLYLRYRLTPGLSLTTLMGVGASRQLTGESEDTIIEFKK